MRVDGKLFADSILDRLTQSVGSIKAAGITPALAVILVGDDPGSLSYIKQKQKAAERIGAKLLFEHLPGTVPPEVLASTIAHFNNHPNVHGLIVQRPVPLNHPSLTGILNSVLPVKDVDGLLPESPFRIPVAMAVLSLLEHIHADIHSKHLTHEDFHTWIQSRSIAVLGKGETAGRPVTRILESSGCAVSVIDSKTQNPETITKHADIIVSCTGRPRTITRGMLSTGVILISVGLSRGQDGKLHGDYEETDVADIASFYTPTPGGVGPVNVASLMQNLVNACILSVQVQKEEP